MQFLSTDTVHIKIPRKAISFIFDECDRFERDETGGRVIGSYEEQGGILKINVEGIIESGPGATRNQVSFFQDGNHQESVFRKIEKNNPKIEHLGNWHTHHVNGLQNLSGGDIETYHKIVNHKNHNTNFFYALLVTDKKKNTSHNERYTFKHYFLRRNDSNVYELNNNQIEFVDCPILWPSNEETKATTNIIQASQLATLANPGRVYDRDFLSEFYKGLRPYTSKNRGGVYWRGPIELIDKSSVEIVVLEASEQKPTYSVALRSPPQILTNVAKDLAEKVFSSARAAAVETERSCNRVIFESLASQKLDGHK